MGHAAEGRQSAGESCPFRMYGTTAMIWDRTNIICLGHSYSRQPIPCEGPFSPKSPDSPYRHYTAIFRGTCRKHIILVISRN